VQNFQKKSWNQIQSVNLAHNNIDYLFITLNHRAHSIYCAEFFGSHHIIHIKNKTWTSVAILKGYPFYVHISLVGSWPLIIAHNKLSVLDCLNLTSLAHLPPFFRNDKIKLIYKRNIRMSGKYIFEESAWAILKGYPFYVHIWLVGSWPLIIAHNKLSALDDLT
jgi:hypothetical protein